MTWVLVILISAAIIGIAVAVGANKRKGLIDSGRMIARPNNFIETKEIFSLQSVDFMQIVEALQKTDLSDVRLTGMKYNAAEKRVNFSGSYGWTAILYALQSDEPGIDKYNFNFTHWNSRNSVPQGAVEMNILLTQIEKIFVSLDPNTKVNTERMTLKTKTKFF
jgi:hypothetical protein